MDELTDAYDDPKCCKKDYPRDCLAGVLAAVLLTIDGYEEDAEGEGGYQET